MLWSSSPISVVQHLCLDAFIFYLRKIHIYFINLINLKFVDRFLFMVRINCLKVLVVVFVVEATCQPYAYIIILNKMILLRILMQIHFIIFLQILFLVIQILNLMAFNSSFDFSDSNFVLLLSIVTYFFVEELLDASDLNRCTQILTSIILLILIW